MSFEGTADVLDLVEPHAYRLDPLIDHLITRMRDFGRAPYKCRKSVALKRAEKILWFRQNEQLWDAVVKLASQDHPERFEARKPKEEPVLEPLWQTRNFVQAVQHEVRDFGAGLARVPLVPAAFALGFVKAGRLVKTFETTEAIDPIWDEFVLNFFLANRDKNPISGRERFTEFMLGGTGSLDKRPFLETRTNSNFSLRVALAYYLGMKAQLLIAKNYYRAVYPTHDSLGHFGEFLNQHIQSLRPPTDLDQEGLNAR